MKLRTKMLVWLGIPFFVIFFLVSVFSYLNASSMIETATEHEMEALAAMHAEEISGIVDGQRGVIEGLTQSWSHEMPSDDEMLNIAESFVIQHPEVAYLYLGYPDHFVGNGDGILLKEEFDATSRGWYQAAAPNNDIQISSVYEDSLDKSKVVTLSKAIRQNGELIAVAGLDVKFNLVEDKVLGFKLREHGSAFLLDKEGRFIAAPTLSINDNIHKVNPEKAAQFLSKEPQFLEGSFEGVPLFYAAHPVGNTGWSLVLHVPKAEIFAEVNTLKWMMIVCGAAALLVLGGILYYIARSISQPIEEVELVAAKVAEGDLTTDLVPTDRSDEIGSLHNSFCKMTKGLQDLIKKTAQTAEQLAASSEELTASADQSAQGAQESSQAVVRITDNTHEQGNVVDQSLRNVEDITSAMNSINDGVSDVSSAVDMVEAATTEGKRELDVAVHGMRQLDESAKGVADAVTALYESSKRISEIVEMITQIAGQTNLLALNAAIEAARAGEQGRGFSVVAEEVRKLAEQSENAAQEITTLITDNAKRIENTFVVMQEQKERVGEGVSQVHTASDKFNHIAEVVKELAAKVDGISDSTKRIRTESERMDSSVREIKSVSDSVQGEAENVAAISEEQAASMQEVAAASAALAQMAQDLQRLVGNFRI